MVVENPWEQGKLLVRRVKRIMQYGESSDSAVAWVSSETPNGGIDSKIFGPVPVQSILARACYFYNDQQVWMEGVFHRRIRVPFRTMSSPCRLTASTFLMDNSFLNSFHLRFSFPLFPTNTLYCTSSIDSATGFSVSTGVKGRTLRVSAG